MEICRSGQSYGDLISSSGWNLEESSKVVEAVLLASCRDSDEVTRYRLDEVALYHILPGLKSHLCIVEGVGHTERRMVCIGLRMRVPC